MCNTPLNSSHKDKQHTKSACLDWKVSTSCIRFIYIPVFTLLLNICAASTTVSVVN